MKDAVALAEYLRDISHQPEQVQDFYPTPSTLSTVMYYTGLDPRTMQPVYVPKDPREKAMQRALMQYKDPKNYTLVHEALELAHQRGSDRFWSSMPHPPAQGRIRRESFLAAGEKAADEVRRKAASKARIRCKAKQPAASAAEKRRAFKLSQAGKCAQKARAHEKGPAAKIRRKCQKIAKRTRAQSTRQTEPLIFSFPA